MTTARTARITRTGGPEVIEWVDVELPLPGPGEVRMRNTAVGLNFIDTYHRGGIYPVPNYPVRPRPRGSRASSSPLVKA